VKASHKGRNVATGVLAGILIIGVAYGALSSAGISIVQKTTVTTTESSTTTVPVPTSSNVVNGLISVSARQYEAYQVNIPNSAYNAQLSGTFTASGGSGNDIIVYVMDATSYVNWQNGHQGSTYYNSGQTTTGSFSVNFPTSGTYYLVYSNTFSTFSTKNVNTQVNLSYTTDQQSVVTYTTTYVTS